MARYTVWAISEETLMDALEEIAGRDDQWDTPGDVAEQFGRKIATDSMRESAERIAQGFSKGHPMQDVVVTDDSGFAVWTSF